MRPVEKNFRRSVTARLFQKFSTDLFLHQVYPSGSWVHLCRCEKSAPCRSVARGRAQRGCLESPVVGKHGSRVTCWWKHARNKLRSSQYPPSESHPQQTDPDAGMLSCAEEIEDSQEDVVERRPPAKGDDVEDTGHRNWQRARWRVRDEN